MSPIVAAVGTHATVSAAEIAAAVVESNGTAKLIELFEIVDSAQ